MNQQVNPPIIRDVKPVGLFTLNLLYVVSGPFTMVYRRHAGQNESDKLTAKPTGTENGNTDRQSTSQV